MLGVIVKAVNGVPPSSMLHAKVVLSPSGMVTGAAANAVMVGGVNGKA
jgi:hypothetical protein